jgi:putative transposase
MARQLRVEYPGAIYHVTCRMLGNARSRLFKDDADRQRFLKRLSERVEQFNIRLYMFVLMKNHFHLVFETPEGNCSRFMQSLSTAYTVYYNLRHRRHGHLFDGRYKAKVVEGDEYLLALTRYVHLNPVKVSGIKDRPLKERRDYLREYRWSSYRSYVGKEKQVAYVDYGPVLSEMSGRQKDWPKRYREFVEGGIAEDDQEFREALKESPRSIGGDAFRGWVDVVYQKLAAKHNVPEDVSFRRVTESLDPRKVLDTAAHVMGVDVKEFSRRRRGSVLRGIAARCLCKYAGQTQREAAATLGIGSGAAVSMQMKKLSSTLPKDRKLRKLLMKVEEDLSRMQGEA